MTQVFPRSVESWRDQGRFEAIGDQRVFVVQAGGGTEVPVVFLHGFPTSSYDWHRIWAELDGRPRLALDLPGYGLSSKPIDYSYSLLEQAEVVIEVLRRAGLDRGHVVDHDMGTSVLTELLARRERGHLAGFEPASITLMNGSVHIDMTRLTPSQKLLMSPVADLFVRASRYPVFKWQLSRILGQALHDEELRALWALLRADDGHQRLPAIMRYVDERSIFKHRWIGALTRLDLPTLVAWGPKDPVAVMAIAERLADEIPGARLVPLEGLGHYPQLEDPHAVLSVLRAFWREAEDRTGPPTESRARS
ncbi:MAG: alpha/beta fold hydrolase [Sandaracinaceae bacterium]